MGVNGNRRRAAPGDGLPIGRVQTGIGFCRTVRFGRGCLKGCLMELRERKACALAVVLGAAMVVGVPNMKTATGQEAGGSLVESLRANGAEVKPLGRRGELRGWLVTPRGQRPYTLYVDGSGHGVMGLLFSPDGIELTGKQVESVREVEKRLSGELRRPPDMSGASAKASPVEPGADREGSPPAPAAGVLEAALAVEGFDLGHAGPQVAIFADPTCLPSRAAVAELARRALDGGIRLRVVPVGARGAESEVMAALVLGSGDRAQAWFTLDRDNRWPALHADAAAGVALNRRLFERTGSGFVPYALMREPDGRMVSAVGADFRAWFGEEAPG